MAIILNREQEEGQAVTFVYISLQKIHIRLENFPEKSTRGDSFLHLLKKNSFSKLGIGAL